LRTIDQSNLDSAGQAPIILPDEAAWPAWINEIQRANVHFGYQQIASIVGLVEKAAVEGRPDHPAKSERQSAHEA